MRATLSDSGRELQVVRDAANQVLRSYFATEPALASSGTGPLILATLINGIEGTRDSADLAKRVLETWLSGLNEMTSIGAQTARAEIAAGAYVASQLDPHMRRVCRVVGNSLAKDLEAVDWPPAKVGWEDYDLLSGPAGAVLALTTDPVCPRELLRGGAYLLGKACSHDDLRDLRVTSYRQDELRSWNDGKINIGLAHGAPGVVAALRAASECLGKPEALMSPLGRGARWVAAQAHRDTWGVLTWPPASLGPNSRPSEPSRRQAWCYGTPGVSWTLWEAGRVLGSTDLSVLAAEAMSSFCAAFDEERYLHDSANGPNDSLTFCHGAVGTLMVCDAFAKHADLEPARMVRDRIWRYIVSRLDDVRVLSNRQMSLLNGATGVLAGMYTVMGAERAWLIQYGLR